MNRKAYIAHYVPCVDGFRECILFEDTYASRLLRDKWDELVSNPDLNNLSLQFWYRDKNQTNLIAVRWLEQHKMA